MAAKERRKRQQKTTYSVTVHLACGQEIVFKSAAPRIGHEIWCYRHQLMEKVVSKGNAKRSTRTVRRTDTASQP